MLIEMFINTHDISVTVNEKGSKTCTVIRKEWPDGKCYMDQYCYIVQVYALMSKIYREIT